MSFILILVLVLLLVGNIYCDFSYSTFTPDSIGFQYNGNNTQYINTCNNTNTINQPAIQIIQSKITSTFITQTYTVPSNTSVPCQPSMILIPAQSNVLSSIYSFSKQVVDTQFSTAFQFRIAQPSSECTKRLDSRDLSIQWNVCSDDTIQSMSGVQQSTQNNGAGFNFIIHNSVNGINALGSTHESHGANIDNSLSIEFDTQYDSEMNQADSIYPHTAIYTTQSTAYTANNRITLNQKIDLSIDTIHSVRITMYDSVKHEYMSSMYMSPNAVQYIRSPVNTLCIWYDNILETDQPVLCMLTSMNNLINLDSGTAYVGFTSSNGAQYQQIELLNWQFCEIINQCTF